jgi:hypothetical protein
MANKNLAGQEPDFGGAASKAADVQQESDPRLVADPSYLRPAPIIRCRSELSEGDAINEDEELVEILSSFGSTKSTARPIGHHIMRTAAASLSKSLKY